MLQSNIFIEKLSAGEKLLANTQRSPKVDQVTKGYISPQWGVVTFHWFTEDKEVTTHWLHLIVI